MLHQHQTGTLFRALADVNRVDMVEKLAASPRSLGALAADYDMTLTAVSQHVKLLERAGLVVTEKVGRARICSVAPAALDRLDGWVRLRRAAIERRLDRLEVYLAANKERAT